MVKSKAPLNSKKKAAHSKEVRGKKESAGSSRQGGKKYRELYEVERRHASELSMLNEMTRAILASQSLDLILVDLAANLAGLLEADDCFITRWDEDQQQTIPKATTARLKSPYDRDILESGHVTMTASVLTAGRALAAEDVFHSPYIEPEIASLYPSRSIMGAPLVFRERKLGALIIAYNTPHTFTTDEMERAERTANHVAVAIWNAEQDMRLKQRLKEQETLANITTTLSQTERVGLPNVLNLIVHSARELIPKAQQAVIHLMDKEQAYLTPEAVSGFDQFDESRGRMRVGEGIAGLVIAGGRSIYIPSVQDDERFISLNPNAKYRSLLVAPILSGDKEFGTISIQSEEPHAFSQNEINLLGELGQQAAIGIENARLYDAAQRELQDRVLAEAALRTSEERYRNVSEDIPAMICRFRADGTLTYVNQYYCQFFGKQPQELNNVSFFAFIYDEEEKARIKAKYMSLTRETPITVYEVQETSHLGEKRWVQWTDRLIFNENAVEVEYQSIGMDITGRKLAEIERERLLQAEREQRLRAETSSEATLALVSHLEQHEVLDEILVQVQRLLPGCATNVSLLEGDQLRTAAYRGYEGRGDEVFQGMVRTTHLFPIDKEIIENPRSTIVSDTTKDPRWKFLPGIEWIRSNLCIPLMWNKEILGLLYIDEDTPNKFTEETISRLTPLVNATTVALESAFLINTTRQALKETSALYHINQKLAALDATELLNDAVELLQTNFGYYHVQVFVIEPATGDFILKAASGGIGKKLVELNYRMRAGSGIIGYAAETNTPFFTNRVDEVVFYRYEPHLPDTTAEMSIPVRNGEKLYGVLDIQQDKGRQFTKRDEQLVINVADQLAVALHKADLYENLQNALQQEKAIRNQLVQNERLAIMGRLLASVSHELNNPLQAIQNALFLLKEETGLSVQGRNDLEIVLAESERMAGLIEQLRDTYRPPQVDEFKEIQVNNVIEDVYALLATHLRKNQIAFEFHPDQDLPVLIAQPDQIRQVILNLFINAVEAMSEGGKLTVSSAFVKDAKEVLVSISDTGAGISAGIMPFIFDPFITNKKEGTGIGLTISHEIVIKHGGRIAAENNADGHGATFKFWLPIMPIHEEVS